MSASFYDLLKYAKTGIAAPDMTAYDKMRAVAMAGGKVKTLTGVPPLSFTGNGKPLISWSMKGNGQQSGTPTPDNPVMPTFCGVRTGNLLDESAESDVDATHVNYNKSVPIFLTAGQTYTFSCDAVCNGLYIRSSADDSSLASANNSATLTYTPQVNVGIYCRVWNSNSVTNLKPMLNLGTTALPYEPYGWAEKITCAGQTTPVYLGQTPTVRKIGKLVLDGTEDYLSGSGNAPFILRLPDIVQQQDRDAVLFMCTHYQAVPNSASWSQYSSIVSWSFSGSTNTLALVFRDTSCADLNAFKSYIAAQYAAGTPVTIWYVLAEPETAIVNEPLYRIGDYCDELHSSDAAVTIPTANGDNTLTVEGDLSPSSMTITYKS